MRYTILGKTGLRVSVLGFGTNRIGGVIKEDEGKAARVMNYALDRGINLISAGYGEVNEFVGRRMASRRDEFVLTSKGTDRGSRTYDRMMRDIEDHLRVLRTDHIDLFEGAMIRDMADLAAAMEPGGAIAGMEQAKGQGKILHIGITSHCADVAAAAIRTGRMDTVLVVYNLINPYATEEMMPLAKEYDVGVMAMRPLAHGALCPVDRAFEYLWANGVHVAVSGMLSVEGVDENVRIAEREPDPERYAQILEEAAEIRVNGCRMCCLCGCSKGVHLLLLLQLWNYRKHHELCPSAESGWQKYVNTAQFCDGCGECEAQCSYGVPIVKEIRAIAQAAEERGWDQPPPEELQAKHRRALEQRSL